MKLQRFIDGAIAADGGTSSYRVALIDGSVLECGLDARIPKTKAQRVIFVGAGYPTLPGARTLSRGSTDEQEFVTSLREFIGRAPDDKLAADFLDAILDR
jgi:hypothetical protein